MTNSRLEQLLQFYNEDPNDPFNAYAVGLEYLKTDMAEAKKFFDMLLEKHPDYIPVYYHAARLYQETGLTEEAVSIYKKGILMAGKSNDIKASKELKSALDELLFD